MDKEGIKRLAKNPKFISGIHNYCDRWCERCPFTARCMNFAMSEEKIEELDEYPGDSDGSAKVALIGMDRSISAWGKMRGFFPILENSILDILLHLQRLRKETENAFPAAREFIRPGFDRVGLNG